MSRGFEDPRATWDARFATDEYVFGTEPNAWLRARGTLLYAGARVLCVADGEGRNSVWLASRGMAVDAFDLSPVAVAKARKLAAHSGASVDYAVGGCDDWIWPREMYDGVVAIFVQFADPAMRARLFANMARCLRSGGILMLQGYSTRQLEFGTGGPPVLENLYTTELLRDSFPGMHIIELLEYEDDLTEGTRHVGRSALIGMVARKP
jgi:SAM-dependent methyltransferase